MVNTLDPPLTVILSWPTPNYVDAPTRGPALVNLCIFFSVLGILIVSARLYSRLFITRAIGIDDGLIVLSLGFGIAFSCLVIVGNKVWWSGHHIWDIPREKFVGHRRNIWDTEWCYVISTSTAKMSVLLFYRRISAKFSKAFMIATWIGIIYNLLYMVAFCLVLLLLCTPISAYWNSFDPVWAQTHHHKCGKENIELPLSGVFSVIGDFYAAVLPMLVILQLDLPRRQKWGLYALFSFAFLVVAAGIVRTVLMNKLMNLDYDFTWILWEMWIWAVIELYMAILAASAPALKPFLRKFFVEPIESMIMTTSRAGIRPTQSRRSGRTYSNRSRTKNFSSRSYSLRQSALIDDPEKVGTAYGGRDFMKTQEESFVREVDDDDLETRCYELRPNRDGKVVPVQVWRSKRSSLTAAARRFSMPSSTMEQSEQKRAETPNFSRPTSRPTSRPGSRRQSRPESLKFPVPPTPAYRKSWKL